MPEVRHLENEEGDNLLIAPELTLRFAWTGDRWSHILESRGQVLAASLEGWDLPAFQQWHAQPDADGESWLALAVGQSGLKHYSASFRVSGSNRVEIDIADRGDGPGSPLALSYVVGWDSVAAGSLAVSPDHREISWSFGHGRLAIQAEDDRHSATRLAVAEAGPRGWRIQAAATTDDPAVPESATRRCRVVWSLSLSSSSSSSSPSS